MRVHSMMSAALAAPALLALAGCATPMGPAATAVLQATTGNQAGGTVQFVQRGALVRVTGEVRGLKPNAAHGFHIHEKGDCSSGDGLSAGGHFNPDGKAHGRHGQGTHHVGDLPSLMADARGVAKVDFESSVIRIREGGAAIVGRGLIVHRDPDDYTTQPTGNAGPRLACAVITNA